MINWMPLISFLAVLAALPLVLWRIYRRAETLGRGLIPLTPDHRLRIALALRLLEDARAELEKVKETTHPEVHRLTVNVSMAENHGRLLLRNY